MQIHIDNKKKFDMCNFITINTYNSNKHNISCTRTFKYLVDEILNAEYHAVSKYIQKITGDYNSHYNVKMYNSTWMI